MRQIEGIAATGRRRHFGTLLARLQELSVCYFYYLNAAITHDFFEIRSQLSRSQRGRCQWQRREDLGVKSHSNLYSLAMMKL